MIISLVKDRSHFMIKDATALWFTPENEIVIEKGNIKHLYNKDYIIESIVASDGFVKSRTKHFLIDGYVNNEE